MNAASFGTRAVTLGFAEIHGGPPDILEAFRRWRETHRRLRPGDSPILRG